MIISYTQLIGKPIVELQNQRQLGNIGNLLIAGDDFTIPGILLSGGFFSKNNRIVSNIDTIQVVRDGVLVRDEDSVIPLSEAIRLSQLVKDQSFGIGQDVFTAPSNEYMGKVHDFQFESNCMAITKFVIRKGFAEKIIPISAVQRLEGKKLYIKDNAIKSSLKHILSETITAN